MVLLASSVFAVTTKDLVIAYSLDNADDVGGNPTDLMTGQYNGTSTGGVTTNQLGILNQGYDLDGTNGYIDTNWQLSDLDEFTLSFWFYAETLSGDKGLMGTYTGGTASLMLQYVNSNNKLRTYLHNDAADFATMDSTATFGTSTWYHVVLMWNGTTQKFFIDGEYDKADSDFSGHMGTIIADFPIGCLYQGGNLQFFDGHIDEFLFWNRTLDYGDVAVGNTAGGEVAELYRNGSGLGFHNLSSGGTIGGGDLMPTLTGPANNDHFNNYTIPLFTWANATGTPTNYSFEIYDNSTSTVIYNLSLNSITNNTPPALNLSQNNWSKWRVCAYNSTILNCTNLRLFYVDTIDPVIIFTTPLNDNSSDVERLINLDVTTSDEFLYKSNLSIFNSSGIEVYNHYSGDITGAVSYNFTALINATYWPRGTYTVFVETTDLHTTKEIKDYKPTKDINQNKLEFEPVKNNKFSISLTTIDKDLTLSEFDYIKYKDRYSMDYSFSSKTKDKEYTNTWRIESDTPLKYVQLDKHKAWLVTKSDHMIRSDGLWFDADFNDKEAKYKIIKVNDYIWDIEIKSKKEKILFNSLGGLNYVNSTRTFDLINYFDIVSQQIPTTLIEFEPKEFNVSVVWMGYNLTADNITAGLKSPQYGAISGACAYPVITMNLSNLNDTGAVFRYNYTPVLEEINNTALDFAFTIQYNDGGIWNHECSTHNTSDITWAYWPKLIEAFNITTLQSQNLDINLSRNDGQVSINKFVDFNITGYDRVRVPSVFYPPSTNKTLYVEATGFIYVNDSRNNYSRSVNSRVFKITPVTFLLCNGSNNTLFNISIYNELSVNSLHTSNLNGKISYYINGSSIPINYSFNYSGASQYAICTNQNISNLSIDATFQYYSNQHNSRFYYLNNYYIGINQLLLDFYTINETKASSINANVYDYSKKSIEGAIIRTLKYYYSDDSYKLVEMSRTNFEGVAEIQLQEHSAYYKFYIYYPETNLKQITEPSQIYPESDIINFYVQLNPDTAEEFYKNINLHQSLSFNNATDSFKYSFSTSSGEPETMKLDIYKVVANSNLLVNTSTLTTSTGEIILGVPIENGTSYIAKSYKLNNGEYYLLRSDSHTYPNDNPTGELGLFMVFILTVVFMFMMVFNLSVGIVLAPIPTLIGSAAGFIAIPFPVAIIIEIIAIILAIIIARNN